MSDLPSLSTDQMAALVELARQGSLRAAADVLYLSEQGVRSRLIALESRLGVELYRKRRGIRRSAPLTQEGRRFLPHAIAFLESAGELTELFRESAEPREVRVVASQYLIAYALIDVVRRFHAAEPTIRIRLSARTEQEIQEAVRQDPRVTLGVAAPYEVSTDLEYRHWFSMDWSLIAPRRHPLLTRRRLPQTEPRAARRNGSDEHGPDRPHGGSRPGRLHRAAAPVRRRHARSPRRRPPADAVRPPHRLRRPHPQRRAPLCRGAALRRVLRT